MLGGGVGEGDRRMTQAGPKGGGEGSCSGGVRRKGVETAGSCCSKGNRDGTIKTQRHGLIVQNCILPTKKKICGFVSPKLSGV